MTTVRTNPEKVEFTQIGDILKVSGTVIRPGTFVGMDGRPTTFTPDTIRNIYTSLRGNVKTFLTHIHGEGGHNGYAYKFALDPLDQSIKYEGMVFDKRVQQKILREGYDKVSGEFDPTTFQSRGHHDLLLNCALTGIAFVKYPAVDNTDVMAVPVRLQKYNTGGKRQMDSKQVIDFLKSKNVTLSEPDSQALSMLIKEMAATSTSPSATTPEELTGIMGKMESLQSNVGDLTVQLESNKLELQKYRDQVATEHNKRFEQVKQEVIGMGVKDPDGLVKDLEMSQKIAVLMGMKETLIANRPVLTGVDIKPPIAVADATKAYSDAIKELGVESRAAQFLEMKA